MIASHKAAREEEADGLVLHHKSNSKMTFFFSLLDDLV